MGCTCGLLDVEGTPTYTGVGTIGTMGARAHTPILHPAYFQGCQVEISVAVRHGNDVS